MAFYSGLSSAQGQQAPDEIPVSGTPVSSGGPVAQRSLGGIGQQGYGSISAPSSVLQNITDYSGSMGTGIGNANYNSGLQNYSQMAQQYGQYGGQWTPWALAGQDAGGMGLGSYDAGNMFVNGGNPNQQHLGTQYSLYGNMVGSRDINRNSYTGENSGYGDMSYQNAGQNPFGYDFWAGQTPGIRSTGKMDYGAVNGQVNSMTNDYINKMQTMYGGGNNEFITPDQYQLGQQLVQGGMPGIKDSNGALNAWYMYAHNQGLAPNSYNSYQGQAQKNQGLVSSTSPGLRVR